MKGLEGKKGKREMLLLNYNFKKIKVYFNKINLIKILLPELLI